MSAMYLVHSVAQIWASPKRSARKARLMPPRSSTQSLAAAHPPVTPYANISLNIEHSVTPSANTSLNIGLFVTPYGNTSLNIEHSVTPRATTSLNTEDSDGVFTR